MSITSFIDQKKLNVPKPVSQGESGFFDVVEAGFEATRNNYNTNSASRLLRMERQNNRDAYKNATGKEFDVNDFQEFKDIKSQLAQDDPTIVIDDNIEDVIYDKLKAENPDKFQDLKGSLEIIDAAKEKAKQSDLDFENALQRTTRLNAFTGGFIGALGGTAVDPVNIATLPFGAGASRSILKASMRAAGINAGAEAATQPAVVAWQKELGNDYGFTDVIENVGLAAVFGGSFEAVTRGVRPAASWMWAKASRDKNLPQADRNAAAYMSKKAHEQEANPNVRQPDQNHADHLESFQGTQKAMKENRIVEEKDLQLSNKEFKAFDSKIRADDTAIQRTSKENLARFQTDSTEAPTRQTTELTAEQSDFLQTEPAAPVSRQDELLERAESPETIAAERAEFDTLVAENENTLIRFEDEEVRLGDLVKRFDDDENFVNEIASCAI